MNSLKQNYLKLGALCMLIIVVIAIFMYARHNDLGVQLKNSAPISSSTVSDAGPSYEDLNRQGKYQAALDLLATKEFGDDEFLNATVAEGVSYFGLGQCHTAMVLFGQASDMAKDKGELLANRLSTTTLQMFDDDMNSLTVCNDATTTSPKEDGVLPNS